MVIQAARNALHEAGVQLDSGLCPADSAVLTAEAVNWAAKCLDEQFYDIKADVWQAASRIEGVQAGWCSDGTFALWAKGVGTAHAHDPWGQLWAITAHNLVDWVWSGIRRQELAFLAMRSAAMRRLLAMVTGAEWHREWTSEKVGRVAARLEQQLEQQPQREEV